ncbi:carboxyl transferase domain-containing protein [soil metagenome]
MSTKPLETPMNATQPGSCERCGQDLSGDAVWSRYRVCSSCGRHGRIGAWERVELMLDENSFEEIHANIVSVDPLVFTDSQPYQTRVSAAREKTGMNEAVLTGRGRIRGAEIVLAVVDFRFLGGSMGSVVGEKIALAFEHAISRKIPIITVVASGGARMQEGMLSLVQMAKTTAAAQRAHEASIPYISVLTDPTTGGIYASFASQGDVILAEPEALIGFAGPRVIAGTKPEGEPAGERKTHTAEYLREHGFIDSIVERVKMRDTLSTILRVVSRGDQPSPEMSKPAVPTAARQPLEAWDALRVARRQDRPTTLDYIRKITPQFVELHGDRVFGDDPAVIAGLGEIGGRGVAIVGHERGHGDERRRGGQALPEGYRKALRIMKLAGRLRIPVVTFIDTPGAFLGIESEERGLASTLSECLATMSVLPVPVVAVIIGEGGSGGALAFGVADRVLMQEHSVYSVIAPEGAAAILFRDPLRAPEVAESLKITAHDCLRLGVADALIEEPSGGAHVDPDFAATFLLDAVLWALGDTQSMNERKRVDERYKKFRQMGQVNSLWREFLSREASGFGTRVARTVGSIRERLPRSDSEVSSAGADVDPT